MRFVVLLFGLPGVALTAFIGIMFFLIDVFLQFLRENGAPKDAIDLLATSPTGSTHGETGLFLMLAAAYGFLGVMLSFCRCGWQGALMMIIPVLCTAIMNPYAAVFTALLVFAGLLSFLVFPLPIAPPKKASADNDREDDDE